MYVTPQMKGVKKLMCECNKSCCVYLTHEKVLKWRLDMKELTEGNLTTLSII